MWLKAFEAGYQEDLLGKIAASVKDSPPAAATKPRPDAQAMFCIDVRSETFRRNLEAVGNYETIGFAGFFTVFIRQQSHGSHPPNRTVSRDRRGQAYTVFELARSNQDALLAKHESGTEFFHTTHELIHDLKANILTPYITVESLGWLFGVPLFGRTLFPRLYRKYRERFAGIVAPPVATNMTIDEMTNDRGHRAGAHAERSGVDAGDGAAHDRTDQ